MIKLSVIKCYNSATGQCETVSTPLPDGQAVKVLPQFATADTNTDHVYYVTSVSTPLVTE